MKKLYVIIIIILLGLIFLVIKFNLSDLITKKNQAIAANSEKVLSSAGDWQLGSTTNMDIPLTLKPKIDNKSLGKRQVEITNYSTTSSYSTGKDNPIAIGSKWTVFAQLIQYPGTDYTFEEEYWQIDLSDMQTFDSFSFDLSTRSNQHAGTFVDYLDESTPVQVEGVCSDGTTYQDFTAVLANCAVAPGITYSFQNPNKVKRLKLFFYDTTSIWSEYPTDPEWQSQKIELSNFKIFNNEATATHTTAPTQIDGGENFWSWDSNTITQTVPTNTTTTYQYRTSANGTDWTAWVGSLSSVTSRTGDDSDNPTRYRYLQIKATLSNTDGISTPTIDQYNISYHIEAKPVAPSAQTAVVQ